VVMSRDITTCVAAEQERRQNEQNNRFIAEHSVDIIHRLSPDCVCTYTSPSVTTLLGYTQEEVLGKPVLSMIHPDDLPGVVKDIAAIRERGEDTVTSSFRFRHKDGRYLRFESTTRIIRDNAGQVKEFLNISRDISGRKTGPSAPDKA
jgi:PAS domain S-box-containing protein